MNKTQSKAAQPEQTQAPREGVLLSTRLVEGLIQYLLTRPIGEAGALFGALEQELAAQTKG